MASVSTRWAPSPASAHPDPDGLRWRTLCSHDGPPPARELPSGRRVVAILAGVAVLASLLVGVIAIQASRILAEREAVASGSRTGTVLATSLFRPALSDELLDGSPIARRELDAHLRSALGDMGVVRVKVITLDGVVRYSDEPRLIGERVELGDEEREALERPGTHAAVAEMRGEENRYEQAHGARLLEVRRSLATESGRRSLLELYFNYDSVRASADRMRVAFLLISGGCIALLLLLVTPLLHRIVAHLRGERDRREALLREAMTASDNERRRIAASLHDGPVQELAGAALTSAAMADRLRRQDEPRLAEQLDVSSDALRATVSSLRSLLVDIYPPELRRTGLGNALRGLGAPLSARGVSVTYHLDDDAVADLDDETTRVLYRFAREALRNTAKHARARHVRIGVRSRRGRVALVIADDGAGFDVQSVLDAPAPGHVGIALMRDLAEQAHARLDVSAATGHGTVWRLVLPESPR